jgi:hypothetical protein
MTDRAWVPQDIDAEQPNPARIYDYLLGGGHNFASDRAAAERVVTLLPGARDLIRRNRAFLRRAVLFMVSAGVRQFLDLGSGIPTVGNVHEIAQQADEQARVVYVDKEPIAVTHSRLLLEHNERATVIQADLCDPDSVLDAAEAREMLDFDQPIGLLTVAVIHFLADELRPFDVLAAYRERLAPGSHLALSHVTADTNATGIAGAMEVYQRSGNPVYPRSIAEIHRMFTGYELVEPGVVSAGLWHPDSTAELESYAEHPEVIVGVGRKP